MTTMFAVGRNDLRRTRWLESATGCRSRPARRACASTCFALTANNVTYGAFGEAMHYWDFFPTGDAETGCIPVWGFATVRESLVDGVDVGERFYGYWPMADEVILAAGARRRARASSTVRRIDAELPDVYNRYLRCEQRSVLSAGDRGVAGAVAAALHHLVPDRRLPRRQRLLRRANGAAVERLEQDGVWPRLLPGAAAP